MKGSGEGVDGRGLFFHCGLSGVDGSVTSLKLSSHLSDGVAYKVRRGTEPRYGSLLRRPGGTVVHGAMADTDRGIFRLGVPEIGKLITKYG